MTETPHNPADLVEAFLRQAQSASNAAAVDDRGVSITYGELAPHCTLTGADIDALGWALE